MATFGRLTRHRRADRSLFADETLYYDVNATQPPRSAPKPEATLYKPRSTNASMDANKKLREKVAALEAEIDIVVLHTNAKKAEEQKTTIADPPRDEVAMEEPKADKFKMEQASRSPVKPIYVVIKEVYPDIDELARFMVQEYCNGRADSAGRCSDQKEMTPNGELRGRAYITLKYGDDQHDTIVKYLSWM